MLDAIENAQQAGINPNVYIPELLQTKVYHLGRTLYERIGKVRFEKFVTSLPNIEKGILKQNNKTTQHLRHYKHFFSRKDWSRCSIRSSTWNIGRNAGEYGEPWLWMVFVLQN